MSKKDFNNFRFSGFDVYNRSNKYLSTKNRINNDETKAIIRIADVHIFKTQYGYGLIIDANHIVWLKEWQVSDNWFGIEILLDKNYFNVKESKKEFSDFFVDDENSMNSWEKVLDVARAQNECTSVAWAKCD